MRVVSPSFKQRLTEELRARRPRRVSIPETREAAVLIPVVGAPEPELILTVRTETLPSHRGQISFPGGSIDPGESSAAAAVREAHEEIGIDPAAIEVLGELDSMPTFVSGYIIDPVVGWLEKRPALKPNPAEVADVFTVPIPELVEDIRAEPGFTHEGRTYPTEAWIYEDRVIWGVTAGLMRSFLTLLGDAGLAAAPGPAPEWPTQVGPRP
jgi:8-oxo-dGTP pyrophosphatase MutT (NUDIX family)